MAKLSRKQLRILKFLFENQWTRRSEMEAAAGKKGFSKALGAPTTLVKPGTLEDLGFVERRDMSPPFEYRINEAGIRALAAHEEEHGEILLHE